MNGDRVNDAGCGCANVGARELVRDGLAGFGLLGEGRLNLLQFFSGLLRVFLFGLRQAGLGFRARRFEFADLGFQD